LLSVAALEAAKVEAAVVKTAVVGAPAVVTVMTADGSPAA
jgi:hypothetical protein